MLRSVRANGATIEYELTQTQRQSMELRAGADVVKVFAPHGVRLRDADNFVRERADWLLAARAQFKQYHAQYAQAHPVCDGAQLLLEGRVVTMRVACAARANVLLEGAALKICAPDDAPEVLRAQLRAYLAERARDVLTERTAHYAKIIGRSPRRIAIREQKTRWGSCSNLGNLNFNWKLIMAPREALDYVVIHELCHLYELNHSPKFWQRVAQYQPDYLASKKWLKEYGQMLGL